MYFLLDVYTPGPAQAKFFSDDNECCSIDCPIIPGDQPSPASRVCVCVSSSYSKIVRRVPLGTAASSQDAPLETVDGGPSRVRDMLASLRHDDLVKPLLLIGGFRFDG